MASTTGKLREFFKKYGKVGLGVHFTVSAASISGLYIGIKNNLDVEFILQKVGLGGSLDSDITTQPQHDPELLSEDYTQKKKSRTAELVASSGGALALAVLCNKALFPVRVPITLVLTPPVARFLARRNIIRT